MSDLNDFPYFKTTIIHNLDKFPKGSTQWILAIDELSKHIKDLEQFLSTLIDCPITLHTEKYHYYLQDLKTKKNKLRVEIDSCPHAVIELDVETRKQVYSDFPALFEELKKSQFSSDRKIASTANASLLGLLKNAIKSVMGKINSFEVDESTLSDLKRLRATAPSYKDGFSNIWKWIKELAKTLVKIKFIPLAIESIKEEIPSFWHRLTFGQKMKVTTIAPLIGIGGLIGGIGVAGMGNAVGIPAIAVTIVLLLISNSVIDFLDFLINILTDSSKIDFDYTKAKQAFQDGVAKTLSKVFESNFTDSFSEVGDNFKSTGDFARDYEFFCVNKLAKDFNGKGFVSPQSRDGGIDGHIICPDTKEVILIQTKYYTKKVGFGDATQYLGTLRFWQKELGSSFDFPITKMIICCPSDFSIEAKRVAESFSSELLLLLIIMN